MNGVIQAYFYDSSITYDPLVVPQADRDKVYKFDGTNWVLFKNSIGEVRCTWASWALTTKGHYEGFTKWNCLQNRETLRTGNYRNFIASVGEGNVNLTKLDAAKRVITDFLNTVNGVRVGAMVFNYSEGGHIQSTIKSLNDTTRTQLIQDFDNIVASTWTPLAETLYEAGLYFKGGPSYFNPGVVYTSPIQYSCQKNYVIIITDGWSTMDYNSILNTAVGDRDSDGKEPGYYFTDQGTHYLDDVAKYLYDTDLSSSFTGEQNIYTYTIGFALSRDLDDYEKCTELLQKTADSNHGHGKYFLADNVQGLADSFQNIINDIFSKTSSFVAPIVPVSRMERSTAGNKIYLALFKPVKDEMWHGNIKKFGVAQENIPLAGIQIGDLTDANGQKALDSNGQILSTARSYWTSSSDGADGGDAGKGGLGKLLLNRSSSRIIYTYMTTDANLTHSSNAFTVGNSLITPTLLGLLSGDTSGRDQLINFVHGYDVYDQDGDNDFTEKREWILGGFIHSRPAVVHYGDTNSLIFAGANDGMLHAFDDETGEELWAFIPPNLLTKLQALHADVLESFVDGSAKVYSGVDKKVLIFGQRRGGNRYYALDITDHLNPKYLWEISPSTTGYEEMGQTWSTPQIGLVRYGTGEKWVMFIGGGYDENQDNEPVTSSDTKGRAVYVVDVLTGGLVWKYSNAESGAMVYSIPSDVARVDTDGNGKIDRLYVGDTGGRMWRFDIGDSDTANWTGKRVFNANSGASEKRKIFYPPDVTLEKDSVGNYELLFFGTGDRENPSEKVEFNRLYAFKDRNGVSVLAENDLVDVTLDKLQDASTTETEKNSILEQLRVGKGWYIKLDSHTGEKALASPIVYFKTVYFTTFTPSSGSEPDPCLMREGTARIYILNYNNGNAVFNLDVSNDTGGTAIRRSDRSVVIGAGIPSGVVITVVGTKAVGYVGVGGGVYPPQLPNGKNLIPVNWRIVF
jgi:type IV pilus assembly protein PilY1